GIAVLHPRGQATAQAVAGAGGVQAVAAARRRRADGLRREPGAAAQAVARARGAAGRRRLRDAEAVRIGTADVDRPAGPAAPRQAAAHTRPLHATLQQTPSVQNLDLHSLSLAQTASIGLRPQLPLTHRIPLAQSVLVLHVVAHLLVVGSQL